MEFKDFKIQDVGREILLVGGVWAGNGNAYLCLFPEFGDSEDTEIQVLEMTTEDWKMLLRQSDIMETEVLAKAEDGTLYKAVMRKSQRNIEQGTSWNVFRRDKYACRYCGNDQIPLTVDHLVLWEDGGPSIEDNLVSACRKCNKKRGNMQYADWLKHPYYLKKSMSVPSGVLGQNEALVATLDGIPRVIKVRKR